MIATEQACLETVLASKKTDWSELSRQIAAGHELTIEEGLAILAAGDEEIPGLLAAAYELRRATFGNTVQLYFLMNAKSGLCPEDCHYCSQSKISRGGDSQIQPAQPRQAARRGEDGRRTAVENVLHRDFGSRAQ